MKKSTLKNIIKEELKSLKEGYGPWPDPDMDMEEMAGAIGYGSFDDLIKDNPGARKAIIDWALRIPDFAGSLERGGLHEGMFSKSPCNAKTLLEGLKTQFQIAFETGVESGGYDDFEKGFWRHNSNEILWKLEEILDR